jgi:hypothetical protein
VDALRAVVAHEMGHAMFDALNVPLFGRPEDAADGFAAYLMLHIGTKEDARRLIGGAASTYKNDIEGTKVTAPITAFADVHGAPVQRFYNLLCMGASVQINESADRHLRYVRVKEALHEFGGHQESRDHGQQKREIAGRRMHKFEPPADSGQEGQRDRERCGTEGKAGHGSVRPAGE